MSVEIGFSCCNYSSCSYWPLKDLLQMCFQCKWWGPKSTVCPHSHLKFKFSKVYMRLQQSELAAVWPLDSVYHSALRFITDDGYNIHHCVLYDKVGWPSLTERRNNHWYLYIYKTLTGKLPSYITSLLHWNSGPLLTCSSDCLALQVLRVRTELGKKLLVLVQQTHGNSYNVT